MQRRTFMIAAVAGGMGVVEYGLINGWMAGMRYPGGISVKPYEKYGAKAALAAITPNDDFYVTSKGMTPAVDASRWQVKFEGLVAHPFTLNYQELLALPAVERELTLECISNPIGGGAIGNARWTGVALKPLIERAQPLSEAAYVAIYGADGLSTGLPLSRLWREENFLAYKMNGEPLAPAHGYPARIFIPGKFGMKQPKWVTRLQFLNRAYRGYWERQGWSDECERWAQARFADLADDAKIHGRNFEITGYAVGNLDGIKAVEISFDDGKSWRPTNLFSNPSPLTWSFWKYVWVDPSPGSYRLRARAIDGRGRVEGEGPRQPYPDGATGQQIIHVRVV